MNAVDGTERGSGQQDGESPSLLTIILDTNPHAWALLEDSLSLSKVVVNLLVFINAHIAINHANRVAVLASHSERAEWLYPTAPKSHSQSNNNHHVEMADSSTTTTNGTTAPPPPDDPNKYRPFAQIEHALANNLRNLIHRTSTSSLSATPATMMAGALTMALAYISKQSAALPTTTSSAQFNYSDPTSAAGGNDLTADPTKAPTNLLGLTSRILILSVSGDLADQYIPIMNAIFACQRLTIPIDILKLAGDTVFLQQAADATNGIYIPLDHHSRPGFLQYLMFAYLPDASARNHLITPGETSGVDFRAACFCHRRVVDVGFVCSICLSIFCEPVGDGLCLTCGSHLSVANFGRTPAVVPRKKKRKVGSRKGGLDGGGGGGDASSSRAGTPLLA